MRSLPSFLVLLCLSSFTLAQKYTSSRVFAHNDYVRDKPFYTAYALGVGYIEADVFLLKGDLMVAHHRNEIVPGKNLEVLYLQPLSEKVRQLQGNVYKDPAQELTLMIDLKTEGVPTLNAVVEKLGRYPDLIACPNLKVMISGSVPDPKKWSEYPDYIYFDGRPGIPYTPDQLRRIAMISTGFPGHVTWDGKGRISEDGRQRISALVDDAHAKGKKFRFWATPDFPEAWRELMSLDMDVIVTDDVTALVEFLKTQN
jgi:alkaline phosphatase